ncbi:MAG: HAMP domain-containing histidine kinase [Ruminococcus sp.]|nr:HAMP domain-containing histidine kinase [Ruminococcus sp.]
MFRKSRVKIIISIMTIIILLLAGTFGIIYYSSYRDISVKNTQMLERYVKIYSENGSHDSSEIKQSETGEQDKTPPSKPEGEKNQDNENPPPKPDGENNPQSEDEKRMYEAAVFYSVKFSTDGNVNAVDNSSSSVTDDYLTSTAEKLLKSDKNKGRVDGYSYLIDETDEYTLVVFLDSTDFDATFNTLIRYTLIFSVVSLVVIFLAAVWLSKIIIRPLEKSHELQKRFISDAGHELKTPVAVIDTNAEVLKGEIGENKWLSNIRYENNRMSLLIKELLSLVRAEKVSEEKEQIDLSRVVIGEILPFESVAYEKGIEINYDKVEDDVFVIGNKGQLSQLISILIDNAISYSYPETEIDVSLISAKGKAVLSVTNSADEISADKAEHIFDRFYRIDDARTDGSHYGLGLSIAKSIVDSHSGEITLTSKDKKVTFTVTLKTIKK